MASESRLWKSRKAKTAFQLSHSLDYYDFLTGYGIRILRARSFRFESQMKQELKYKGDVCEVIHLSASALFRVGAIDKTTMHEFEKSCLAPAPFKPQQIKRIRQNRRVSQTVFARYLNASKCTVERWEAGTQNQTEVALKLLALVQKQGLQILA
jgi:putative transcriptional regulator